VTLDQNYEILVCRSYYYHLTSNLKW